MSKVVDAQPNWLDIFMYGHLCPKLWTPQPNWLDIFVFWDLCPKLWTPQPNWLDIFVFGDLCHIDHNFRQCCKCFLKFNCNLIIVPEKPHWGGNNKVCMYVQSCGRPSLTGLIYSCTGINVQSCGRLSLTGLI